MRARIKKLWFFDRGGMLCSGEGVLGFGEVFKQPPAATRIARSVRGIHCL